MRCISIILLVLGLCNVINAEEQPNLRPNEIFAEVGGVGRMPVVFQYSRTLWAGDLWSGIRFNGVAGISPIAVRSIPSIPIGFTFRTGDPEAKGLCVEAGLFCVIGDTITVREDAFLGFKDNEIDLLPSIGLVHENKSTLFKLTFANVLYGQSYESFTAGVSVGIRF
jgi:hypothetical protein